MHKDDAVSALKEAKAAKGYAHEVHDQELVPLMEELNELSGETEEQAAALAELMEAFEKAKALFSEADQVQNKVLEEAKQAEETVGRATTHVEMAEQYNGEIDGFIAAIEELIENVDNIDPNDEKAEQAAE